MFDSKAKKVRAALVMSKTLNAWPVEDSMCGDLAVVQLITTGGQVMYIASLYADQTKAPISIKLKNIYQFNDRTTTLLHLLNTYL